MSTFLGALIRARREHLKMSQERLAHKAGYSVSVIARIEHGKPVHPAAVVAVSKAVGLEAVRK